MNEVEQVEVARALQILLINAHVFDMLPNAEEAEIREREECRKRYIGEMELSSVRVLYGCGYNDIFFGSELVIQVVYRNNHYIVLVKTEEAERIAKGVLPARYCFTCECLVPANPILSLAMANKKDRTAIREGLCRGKEYYRLHTLARVLL